RYAGRTLARARGFTLVAVLSLGLGIGATTAILTLVDAVIFTTVPVERPDRLYFLGHDPGPEVELSSNYPILERYQTASSVFSGVTAYRRHTFRVKTVEGSEEVPGQYVSGNYHAVVGAPFAVGRGFSSEVDRRSGGSLLAVVSYDYWVTRLGGAGVLGQTLTVDDRPMTIVGVTARGFHGLNPGEHFEITLPMSVMALDANGFFDAHDGWIGMPIVARLAPGAHAAEALAATDALFKRFIDEPENREIRTVNPER